MAEACSSCGIELPDGASFCAECGTAAPASEAPVPPPQPWPSSPPDQPPTPAEMPPLAPMAVAADEPPLPPLPAPSPLVDPRFPPKPAAAPDALPLTGGYSSGPPGSSPGEQGWSLGASPEGPGAGSWPGPGTAPATPPPVPQWATLPPPPGAAGAAAGVGGAGAIVAASPSATVGAPRNTVAGALGVLGALLLGVSSFLAWAEVTLSVVTERTQTVTGWDWFDNGIDTGPVFAVLALAAAGLAGLVLAQVTPLAIRITVVAVGGLSLGLAAFAISDILGRKSDLRAVGQVDVTLQYGIWLLVIGALLILVSGLVAETRPGPAAA